MKQMETEETEKTKGSTKIKPDMRDQTNGTRKKDQEQTTNRIETSSLMHDRNTTVSTVSAADLRRDIYNQVENMDSAKRAITDLVERKTCKYDVEYWVQYTVHSVVFLSTEFIYVLSTDM